MLRSFVVCFASSAFLGSLASGDEPIALADVRDPGANRLDEPVAKAYSLDSAVRFLDSAALTWQRQRKCFTCHTNYAYLYARPLVSAESPVGTEIRRHAEELVTVRWKEEGPRWDAEVVATAAALAFNDAATTGKLHGITRLALDRMWAVQRTDGGWNWLNCDWPPMESDEQYGVCLAALATAVAPENYRKSELASAGLEKVRAYLGKHPPPTLHHEAMLLWASSYGEPILTPERQREVVEKLRALQRADGGWSLPTLGSWQREDRSPQSTDSDGYGTGFVVYVLRRAGVPAEETAIRRGVGWLKANQRESGRWITRSLRKDSHHFLSHIGTSFAVMALAPSESIARPAEH